MCKPVLPLVQDELAHIFWKARHLATVHHHHGDHHAHSEVAEAELEEHGHKQPAASKIPEPVSVHMMDGEIVFGIPKLVIHKQQYSVSISKIVTISLDKYYPPPRCS